MGGSAEGRGIIVLRPAKGNMMKRLRQSACIVLAGYLLIWLFIQFPEHRQNTDVVIAKSEAVVLPIVEEKTEKTPETIDTELQNSSVQPVVLSDCERLALELDKYDWDSKLMLAIVKAESSCRINALGDTSIKYYQDGREYGYSVGFFQIRILPGREHCDVYDVETNVRCAYAIYSSQGLNAWSVYTSGRYRAYL